MTDPNALAQENDALRAALRDLEAQRAQEAAALRDSQACFHVLDSLTKAPRLAEGLDALVTLMDEEFAPDICLICRADGAGQSVTLLAQAGTPALPAAALRDVAHLMSQPAAIVGASALGPQHLLGDLRSAMVVPLILSDEPAMALICLSATPDPFTAADLRRLSQMARVANQPVSALSLAKRNDDLAALICGGKTPETPPDASMDQPFQTVNRALDRLTRGQAMVVEILDSLLTATADALDHEIGTALSRLGPVFGLDRICVFDMPSGPDLSALYEWHGPGVAQTGDGQTVLKSGSIAGWVPDLMSGRPVHILDVSALAPDDPGKEALQSGTTRSRIMAPILDLGHLEGVAIYDTVHATKMFLSDEVALLRSFTNAIGAVLRKRRAELHNLKAQRDLDMERSRLQATLSALPDLVIEIDDDGRFSEHYSHANSRMAQIADNLVGRTLGERLDPDLARLGHQMLAEVAQHGKTEARTFRHDLGGGDLRWIKANAVRRRTVHDDDRAGFLFVLRDMSKEVTQAHEISVLGEVVKRTRNMVLMLDTAGQITWVNAAFEQKTGWSLEEIKGRSPSTFLYDADHSRAALQRIHDALRNGEPALEEVLNTSRSGETFWVQVDLQPIFDDSGLLTGFLSLRTDITQRKEQEAALAAAAARAEQAQARLMAAVESLDDGFVYFDRDDRLVICNERYRQLCPGFEDAIKPGVTREAIFRAGLEKRYYADAIGREDAWLADRLAVFAAGGVVLEMRLADGRCIRVFDKTTPDGGRVGLRVDVTALKQAEERALSDSAATMDAALDGIAISTPLGGFVYANPAFLSQFRMPGSDGLIGRSWKDVFGAAATRQITAATLEKIAIPGDSWRGEIKVESDDGNTHDCEVSITLRADGASLWMVRNLDERRQAEQESNRLREELQTAQRREVIGQLAAGLAHDFNNLIAAISGSATLILDDDGQGALERAQSHAMRIQKSAERAEAMVRRLLALGARPVSSRATDMVPVLREAADLLRPGLGQSVRLHLDLPDVPMLAALEPTDLLQIVLNLSINARDAMANSMMPFSEQQIDIKLRHATSSDVALDLAADHSHLGTLNPARSYACLTVYDNGPGIPSDVASRIFTPYFSTKGEKGSGLGLAIVSGVIKAADGMIVLHTPRQGGAEFRIFLPLAPDPAIPDTSPEAPAVLHAVQPPALPDTKSAFRSLPLKNKSVLIVDDSEDVLSVIAALLERAGAEVAPTSDAEAAFEVLEEEAEAFDLVVTDFDMGQFSGADLARTAHTLRPDLPVILVTALPDWRVRDRNGGEDPAFFAVLGKPVSSEGLVAAAIAALSSRHN